MNELGVVGTALGSALAAAVSSVLQHRCAQDAPPSRTHRLLRHLVTHPLWIAGLLAAGLGLALHAVALANGQLAVVQPLLVSGVLFALPASALLEGRRPSGAEWLLALAVVGGLTMFLLAARPSPGRVAIDADTLAWMTVGGAVVVLALTVVGRRWPHNHAPLILGAASGVAYGVAAALLKQTTVVAQSGAVELFTDWPVYALIATGGGAVTLTQLAYRAGPLAHSMPALTITDPAASIGLGALAFHESLATDPVSIALQLLGFATMGLSAAGLARRTSRLQGEVPAPS